MSCPLYEGERTCRCGAVADAVTPTLHERERFCRSTDYGHCPTLRTLLRLGRPLREDEYLANWLPPAPAGR
jgi:hypothetical protein